MVEVHLLSSNGHTSCPVQLQYMNGGEKGDAQEVRRDRRRKAQDSQADHYLVNGDPGSAIAHNGHRGRPVGPETRTVGGKAREGKG